MGQLKYQVVENRIELIPPPEEEEEEDYGTKEFEMPEEGKRYGGIACCGSSPRLATSAAATVCSRVFEPRRGQAPSSRARIFSRSTRRSWRRIARSTEALQTVWACSRTGEWRRARSLRRRA